MGMSTNTVLHTRRWLPPLPPIIPAPSTNTQLAPWWVSKRRRTRQTMCVPQEAILRSAPFIQFLLPERRLLPDIPGETRWCPCSPSWIIITMNATSFPVLTAATVLPAQQAGTLGKLLVSGRSVEHHARGFYEQIFFPEQPAYTCLLWY